MVGSLLAACCEDRPMTPMWCAVVRCLEAQHTTGLQPLLIGMFQSEKNSVLETCLQECHTQIIGAYCEHLFAPDDHRKILHRNLAMIFAGSPVLLD